MLPDSRKFTFQERKAPRKGVIWFFGSSRAATVSRARWAMRPGTEVQDLMELSSTGPTLLSSLASLLPALSFLPPPISPHIGTHPITTPFVPSQQYRQPLSSSAPVFHWPSTSLSLAPVLGVHWSPQNCFMASLQHSAPAEGWQYEHKIGLLIHPFTSNPKCEVLIRKKYCC